MAAHRNPSARSLSVIVPATDAPPTLGACLEALRSSDRAPDEIIAVREPAGCGPAAARNAGASRARGELLVFVDADVLVHPDALGRLEAGLRDGADGVFGSYDDRPPHPSPVSRFRNLLHHHVHASSPGEAETFWAGLGGLKAEVFAGAGGFDETAFARPSVEDVELGLRLHRMGATLVLDPAARGTHLKRWTLWGMVVTDLRDRGLPWSRIILRSRRAPRTLNLAWRHRLTALAAITAIASGLRRRPATAAGALAAIPALHPGLYALLWRRGGGGLAGAGVLLHCLHSLCGAAALAFALAELAADRALRRSVPGR